MDLSIEAGTNYRGHTQVIMRLIDEFGESGARFNLSELNEMLSISPTSANTDKALRAALFRASSLIQAREAVIESFWLGSGNWAIYTNPPRFEAIGGSIIQGDYDIEARLPHLYSLSEDGKKLAKLTYVESQILYYFAKHKDKLIKTDEIIREIFGEIPKQDISNYRNIIRVRISDLRKKLDVSNIHLRLSIDFPTEVDGVRKGWQTNSSMKTTYGGYAIISTKGKAEGTEEPGYIWTNLDDPKGKPAYPDFDGFEERSYVVVNSQGEPVFLKESEQRLFRILLFCRGHHRNFDEMSMELSAAEMQIQLPLRTAEVWNKLKEKLELGVDPENSLFDVRIVPKGKGKTYLRRFGR